MADRVEVSFRWYGPPMPAGAPVKYEGRTIGRLLEPTKSGDRPNHVAAIAEVDPSFVDKLAGDGSGYGFPRISVLITRD